MKSGIGVLLLVCFLLLTLTANCVQGDCKDKLPNCTNYSKDVCSAFPTWSEKHCAKYCGVCKLSTAGQCPSKWTYYYEDETCLRVFGRESRLPFKEADVHCQSYGGHLVIIKDEKKNSVVEGLIGTKTKDCTWIGLYNSADVGSESYEFHYATEVGTLGSYHPWLPNNPDNQDGFEQCVCMYQTPPYTGKWNDARCFYNKPFVCQMPLSAIE